MRTFHDADELIEHLRLLGATVSAEFTSMTQLDHGLQTAALLRQSDPDDFELQAAGLVHDLAHPWDGPHQSRHATMGAEAVRFVLGDRVAAIVGGHVAAKRYLLATLPEYYASLSNGSRSSLGPQGGPMSDDEVDEFESHPEHLGMVALRAADDAAKVPGEPVPGLDVWIPTIRMIERVVRESQRIGA